MKFSTFVIINNDRVVLSFLRLYFPITVVSCLLRICVYLYRFN